MIKVLNTVVKIPRQSLKKGVVLLDLDEYRKLQAQSIPTYYLKGKKAVALDHLVEEGLKEHYAGKTIKASSLKEALKIYNQKSGKH